MKKQGTLYDTLLEKLRACWEAQPDKPEETPESALRALCLAAAGNPVSARKAVTVQLPELDHEGLQTLNALVERRCSGTPLAHLTGRQHFMGIEMLSGSGALIPRKETEILGYEALRLARSLADDRGSVTALDICTGSGNIALALASHEPRCRAFGSDLSTEATELALRNARHLGLEERVHFRQGDMFEQFYTEEFLGNTDLVTCNPPYIPTARVGTMHPEISRHEPRMAFDGGSLGISVLATLIREAGKFLKPHSYLCFEVGQGQELAMARKLKTSPVYREVRTLADDDGHVRVLVART